MPAYQTLDYLPDLSASEMSTARTLNFAPMTSAGSTGWDNRASVFGSEKYALLHATYKITAQEGATYDIFSTSFFDPYILIVYDAAGNAIAANDESDDGTGVNLGDGIYLQDVLWDLKAPYSGTYYVSASWNQGSYYTYYSLNIYEDVDTIPSSALMGTALNDVMGGTAGKDTLNGLDGNDVLAGWGGNDVINGGAGIDTAQYAGARAGHTITKTSTGYTVVDTATGAIDSLIDVERLRFADKALALDIDGNAGQAYRLYQAAFDRKPDLAGLGAQMNGLDSGMSLLQISQNFINSQEFALKYGTNPSNDAFVTQLYANVLHRTPDAGGYAVQVGALNGGMSRAQMLVNFSESTENYNATIVGIQSGIEYTPFA